MAESPAVQTRLSKAAMRATDEDLAAVVQEETNILKLAICRPETIDKEWNGEVWDILERNMKKLLQESSLGWDARAKRAEIFHKDARFLVYREGSGRSDETVIAAFACFRFEGDPDFDGNLRNVLYCYELQVAPRFQGLGLGRRLLNHMQNIAKTWKMDRILLTCLKGNERASKFYFVNSFEIDTTSPAPDECADYNILTLRL